MLYSGRSRPNAPPIGTMRSIFSLMRGSIFRAAKGPRRPGATDAVGTLDRPHRMGRGCTSGRVRGKQQGAMTKHCNNPQEVAPERLGAGERHHWSLAAQQAGEIAERQRAEAALRESEERCRRIVETTHEGIWMADLTGITAFVNPQMSRMLGATPEQMIGRPVYDFVFEEDCPVVRQHFAEFLQQPAGKRVEERLRRIDGAELWTVVAASVVLDAHRQPVSFLGMFTDITERKRMEEVLRDVQHTLERRVRERTAELQASR